MNQEKEKLINALISTFDFESVLLALEVIKLRYSLEGKTPMIGDIVILARDLVSSLVYQEDMTITKMSANGFEISRELADKDYIHYTLLFVLTATEQIYFENPLTKQENVI